MIESIIHTSASNNIYLYNDLKRSSILIHPELEKVCKKKSTDLDPYYVEKYLYLKKHVFFAKSNPAKYKVLTLNTSKIEENIIQTRQIVFEVTSACNLKCLYCANGELYEQFSKKEFKNIDINSALKLLKYIFHLRSKNNINTTLAIAFYGGEPLLNMTFIKQIVEEVNKIKIGQENKIFYTMTTNGTLLHKYIDFLAKNKFHLLISLDGNEYNHSYRVLNKDKKNSFHKVIDNIDMIQEKHTEYFSDNIEFNAVLHNRNSAKEIYNFIYNKYSKIPLIAPLSLVDVKPDKKHIIDRISNNLRESENEFYQEDSELSHVTHIDSISFKEASNFLKYYSINYYFSNIASLVFHEKKHYPTNTCIPFTKKIFMTYYNALLPCERINHKYTMGEVSDSVIFNTTKITQEMNNYYKEFGKICSKCYVHRFCGVCMFSLNNLNSLGSKNFTCERFHDQNDFKVKLYRIFSFLEKHPNDFIEIIENIIIDS